MERIKKIIILTFIVILLVFGVFFWWQNQKDIRELNKILPQGIKITKNFNDNYKIINRIDGYEFRLPDNWRGIEEIKYEPVSTEKGYTGSSLGMEGKQGESRIIAIDSFKIEGSENLSLEQWAKNHFENFGLVGDFHKENIEGIDMVKTKENVHLLGMSIYFFRKNLNIYAIVGGSEKIIENIILGGKW